MFACRKLAVKSIWLAVGVLAALPAHANPEGATVVSGSAQFANPDANTLEVTNSSNTIIDWRAFSIDQGETTRFIQPSSGSAVLNRVTGADPTSIYGELTSNGRVFLINQNGILVGESGMINTAGFVGSTLDISNGDFLNNELNFIGEQAAAILNRGFITTGAGGEIVLVAPTIENHGAISAENGRILLAAGEQVTLGSAELDNIRFEIQAPENSVLNLGDLIAEKGSVGVFAGSIQHEGVIEANSIGTDAAGNIVLKAQSDIEVGAGSVVAANGASGGDITIQSDTGDSVVRGNVDAVGQSGQGGDIKLLGDRVGLFGEAYVDASGTAGGGEVLVGGDYQGQGDIQTSQQTQTGRDSQIHADALESGDGGRVIVWADGFTEAHGRVTARGGRISGDGGFIEVSGKNGLVFRGQVDAGAEYGEAGTALFDPRDITIAATGADVIADNDEFAENPSTDVTFSGVDLGNLLDLQNVTLEANNDIFIQTGVAGSGNDLTLMAGRSIIAPTGPFTVSTLGGDFTAIANATLADGVVTADRVSGAADISLNSGNGFFIDTGGGNILLEIRDGAGRTGGQATAGTINVGLNDGIQSGGGSITLRADNGVTAGGSINAGTGQVAIEPYSTGATIDLGAAGTGDQLIDSSVTGAITAAGLTIGNMSGGDIMVESPFTLGFANNTIRTGGDLNFNQGDQDGITADSLPLTINVGGAVAGSGTTTADIVGGAGGSLDITSVTGMDFSLAADQLRFNNTGEGAVRIISRIGSLSVLGGSNSAASSSTFIAEQTGGITFTGDFTHNANVAADLEAVTGINVDPGVTLQGNGGGTTFLITGSGSVSNDGTISDSGGVLIDAPVGQVFNNGTGIINTAGGAGNIEIISDDINLATGSSIDAGPNAVTTIRGNPTTTTWVLGGINGRLTSDELDTIANTIAIGAQGNSDFTTLRIEEALSLTQNQNLLLETDATGVIDFAQLSGPGISGASTVELTADSVVHNASGLTDVSANSLVIDAPGGVGLSGTPLISQVGSIDVVSNAGIFMSNTGAVNVNRMDTTGGAIDFQNNGGDLTILPTGVQNTGTTAADTLALAVTGGGILVDGALVSTDAGNITLNAEGDIQLIGSDQPGRAASVVAGGGNAAATLNATNVLLQGGSADNNIADLRGSDVDVTATTGNIRLIGGDGLNTQALIQGSSTVALTAGNSVLMQGGAGDNADALVDAPSITADATSGDFSLLGGGGVSARAEMVATTDITLSAGNNVLLQGGTGDSASVALDAPLLTAGASGNFSLLGGTATGAEVRMSGQSVSVAANTGNLELTAGDVADARVGISSVNDFAATVGGDLILQGGAAQGAEAVIGEDGASTLVSMEFAVGGNLTLTGGSGADAAAGIGASDRNADIDIGFSAGTSTPVGGDITITAGSGGVGANGIGALAAIGTFGPGNNANVRIHGNGSLTMASDLANGNEAFIGSSEAGGTVELNIGQGADGGNLNINSGRIYTTGTVDLLAGAGGVNPGDIVFTEGGLVDVGTLSAGADGSVSVTGAWLTSTGGAITVDAGGDIEVLGGGEANRSALIEGGDNTTPQAVSLTAANNIVLQGSTFDDSGAQVSGSDVSLTATGGDIQALGGDGARTGARVEGNNLTFSAANLTLQGGAGTDAGASMDSVTAFQGQFTGNLTIQGGTGDNSIAALGDTGSASLLTVRLGIGGDLVMNGGSGADALAAIGSRDGPVDIEIGVDGGGLAAPIGGDIVMTAGSGAVGTTEGFGAVVGIGTFGAGNDVDVTLRANGSLTITSDTVNSNNVFIGADDAGGAVNIDVGQGAGGGSLNLDTGYLLTDGTATLRASSGASANGNIALSDGLIDVGTLNATADGGDFTLDGGNLLAAGTVDIQAIAGGTANGDVSASNGSLIDAVVLNVIADGRFALTGAQAATLGGGITVDAGGDIAFTGGDQAGLITGLFSGDNATPESVDLMAGNSIILQGGGSDDTGTEIRGSDMNLTATAGDIQLLGGGGANTGALILATGSLSQTAGNNIVLQDGANGTANVIINAAAVNGMAGGDISVSGSIGGANGVTLNAGGDLQLTGNAQTASASFIAGGDEATPQAVSLTAANNIVVQGDDSEDPFVFGSDVDLIATGGDIVLDAGRIDSGALNATANGQLNWQTGSVIIAGTGPSQLNGVLAGGATLRLLNGGTLALNGGGSIGALQLNGMMNGTGATTLNVTGLPRIDGGGIGPDLVLNAEGGLNVTGPMALAGVVNNGGAGSWTSAADITGAGTFNNLAAATFRIDNNRVFQPVFNNEGIVFKSSGGTTGFAGGFNQSDGTLKGFGTIATPALTIAGGQLAPGTALESNAADGVAGLLTVDGDLLLGPESVLSLDLFGADTDDGSQVGVLYDGLTVTGNAQLGGGDLELVVNTARYSGEFGNSFRPFDVSSVEGSFGSVSAVPADYSFRLRVTDDGQVGIYMTGTPFGTKEGDFISEDEVETLNQNLEEQLEDIVRIRRKKMFTGQTSDEEERDKRRARVCS